MLANNQAYLLDAASDQLDVLGLGPVHTLTAVPVPPGSNQLVSRDNLVFVNNDASPSAAVVDSSGRGPDRQVPAPRTGAAELRPRWRARIACRRRQVRPPPRRP